MMGKWDSYMQNMGIPGGATGKESSCNAGAAGDPGSIPGSGRSPGGGHGNPLQYSCLEQPKDRGAWLATAHQVPLSIAFCRQESWSGFPCPPPGDLPYLGTEPKSHVSCVCWWVLYH